MKRVVLLFIALLAVGLTFSACKAYKAESNIVSDSEFIYCDDPNCSFCHGTGWGTCTACGGSGSAVCSSCNGRGEVDCTGMSLLGLDCEGGYYTSTVDTANYASDRHHIECDTCFGSGHFSDGSTCYDCNGTGWMVCGKCEGRGMVDCNRCGGDGRVDCSSCDGYGKTACGESIYFATCLNCGARLDSGATVCTNCGMNAEVFVCGDCGAKFNEPFEVCPNCGND